VDKDQKNLLIIYFNAELQQQKICLGVNFVLNTPPPSREKDFPLLRSADIYSSWILLSFLSNLLRIYYAFGFPVSLIFSVDLPLHISSLFIFSPNDISHPSPPHEWTYIGTKKYPGYISISVHSQLCDFVHSFNRGSLYQSKNHTPPPSPIEIRFVLPSARH
jgi:hypothetical protein